MAETIMKYNQDQSVYQASIHGCKGHSADIARLLSRSAFNVSYGKGVRA